MQFHYCVCCFTKLQYDWLVVDPDGERVALRDDPYLVQNIMLHLLLVQHL